jgi:Glycosyltransferase family 87
MRGNVPPVPGAQQPAAKPGGLGAPAAETPRRRRLSPVTLAIIATTALALFLRLWQLTKHGYLLGVTEYDDGVYFGAAVRLIHGVVPYKDFITVQPPGVMLLMTPVAALAGPLGTAKALAIGRILTACAGAGGVTLTGLAIRHRGVLPVAVAGGFLAVYPDGVYAAHTVLIEPWLVLFCLAGTLAVMDGDHLAGSWQRLGAGGIAFGIAGVCKAWAVFPVLVLLAGMARTPRRAGVFLGGVIAGFVLPALPFALLAPHAFYSQVLVAQWSRTDDVRISLWFRLASMIGFSHGPDLPHVVLFAVVCATVALAVWASLWASLASSELPPALEAFALFTVAIVAIAFLVPNDYYYHYAAFLGPFLALAVVLPVTRLASVLRSRREAPGAAAAGDTAAGGAGASRVLYRGGLAVTVVVVLVLAVLQARTLPDPALHGIADAAVADEQIIPAGSCVVTDTVSYTIAANRFVSTVPGCPLMVDSIGSDYTLSHGRNGVSGAGDTPAVRQFWLSALSHAQYLWLSGQWPRRLPWTATIASYFNAHFRLIRADASGRVFQRVRAGQ